MELGTWSNAAEDARSGKEPFPWELGVFDAHCHPTDTPSSLADVSEMKARVLTIMATRAQDQDLVAKFQVELGLSQVHMDDMTTVGNSRCQIVPSFGWHPWFSHLLYDDSGTTVEGSCGLSSVAHYKSVFTPSPEDDGSLAAFPKPLPLSRFVDQARVNLQKYPLSIIGEVGLDRSFRVLDCRQRNHPSGDCEEDTSGSRDGRRLSPYRVHLSHQRKVLKAQLQLASEMQRPVSVHGVAAHGLLFESLRETWKGHEVKPASKRPKKKQASSAEHVEGCLVTGDGKSKEPSPKPFPPRICLHSFSGPPDTVKQYLHPSIPATIFFSFSYLVNLSNSTKAIKVIKSVPDDRILAESDFHRAGSDMDDLLEKIIRIICEIKNWPLDFGVKQLRVNWVHFVSGQRPQIVQPGR